MKKEGKITHVIWTNGTYSIVALQCDNKIITAKGNIPDPIEGVQIEMEGKFEKDPKYGMQFKVERCSIAKGMPSEAIIAYLSSGFIKGVGRKTAELIVAAFGADTLDVIENTPEKLASIPRISDQKAQKIHDMHMEHNIYMEIYNLFGGKITDHQVNQIYDTYGVKAVEKVKENPYRLIYEVDGLGFKKVDILAQNYGISPDSDERLGAAIGFVLKNIADQGNCYTSADSIEGKLKELLGINLDNSKISDILVKEIQNKHLVYDVDGDRLYLASIYYAETYCAEAICEMLESHPTHTVSVKDVNNAIKDVEAEYGFDFEDAQKDAVRQALRNRISVITGGPGTGKTTIIRAIMEAWNDDETIILVAPTGKASRRMSDLTYGSEASTIHKLLHAYNYNRDVYDSLDGLIICDEASMLDISLAAKLMEFAVRSNSSLVLIGDINQLPPIGPGNYFRDLVNAPEVPTTTLQLTHRNAGSIARNAAYINEGKDIRNLIFDDKFSFIHADKEKAFSTVVSQYKELVQKYGLENVCCLVPTRKPGKWGNHVSADDLNKAIRDEINPITMDMVFLRGCDFRINDRVMQTLNDYKRGVFNGDCGTITDINLDENVLEVTLDSGKRIDYNVPESQDLVLAYAMTVHKSQGSEYKAVVLAECMEHYIMLQRNLLYTGVTRAKNEVVLIGEAKAVNIAISTVSAIERNTWLKQRIHHE